MPVGSSAGHESEEIAQCSKTLDVFRAVARMPDLHTVEPGFDERLEPLSPSFPTGMGPHDNRTRGMCDRYGFSDFQASFCDVTRPPRREVSVERFARIAYVATLDQRPCDVWSPDRTACSFLHHGFQVDIDAEVSQSLDDVAGAPLARITKLRETLLDESRPRYMKSEKVNLAITFVRAELDTRHDTYSERSRGELGFLQTSERIMISQRNCREPRCPRRIDDSGGSQCPVRRRRVHVQVDLSGLAHRLAHGLPRRCHFL